MTDSEMNPEKELQPQPRHESCSAPLPYPKPVIESKNFEWARLLLEDYAGETSEFTAIGQYIFSEFVLDETYFEIAQMFKGIAISEMKHLDLLAGVIIQLGVYPKFRTLNRQNNIKRNWTPEYIKYEKNAGSALLEAIRSEKRAIEQYRRHIELISNAQIRELLNRIIIDEELHMEKLTRFYSLLT